MDCSVLAESHMCACPWSPESFILRIGGVRMGDEVSAIPTTRSSRMEAVGQQRLGSKFTLHTKVNQAFTERQLCDQSVGSLGVEVKGFAKELCQPGFNDTLCYMAAVSLSSTTSRSSC